MEIQVNELLNGDLRVTELAWSQNWYGENTVKWNESVTITVLENTQYLQLQLKRLS